MAYNPLDYSIGVGELYTAPIGTALPTDPTTALNVAFVKIGATEEGHTWNISPEWESHYIAESFDPVYRIKQSQEATVEFQAAELTAANMKLWFNGGTITAGGTGGTAFESFVPPLATDTPTEVMLAWESAGVVGRKERVIWPRVINTGDWETARSKENKALIGFSFTVLQPATGQVFYRFRITA